MITVDAFAGQVDETRRDRWGRYLVVPPGTTKPTGYTRATTITKTLDDTNSLISWAGVTGIAGAMSRPGLLAAWQALVAEHGPNPWYSGDTAKARAKALFESCKEAGGASDRATWGTALHAIVEMHNKGQTPTGLTADMAADLDAYRRTLDAAGIVVDPTMCERVVVLDEWNVAGTADMLAVTVPGYNLPLTADLKTGSEIKWSLLAISMQLAIYNHADAIYVQAADPRDDRRLPMPVVDRDHALIVHLPAGEARCELHVVDTAAGWEAFRVAMDVRKWRTRKNLARLLPVPDLPATPAEPSAPAGVAGNTPSGAAATSLPDVAGTVEAAPPTRGVRPAGSEGQPTPAEQLATIDDHPDDGDDADPAAFDALQGHYAQLDTHHRATIAALVKESQAGRVSFHAAGHRTVRRFELIRGLITLAGCGALDPDTVRALVVLTAGRTYGPAITTGHALGSLDHHQAARFACNCDALAAGNLTATVHDDGTLSLHPAA